MADKTKEHFGTTGQTIDFENYELQETLEEYMREETKNGTNFWNFSTVTGLVMVFVAMTVITQTFLGNTFGISFGPDLSGAISFLPIAGAVLLALVGFGFISSEKSKKNKSKSSSRGSRDEDPLDAFLYPDAKKQSGKNSGSSSGFYSGEKTTTESSSGSKKSNRTGDFDDYALSQKKRLFKSRTDKKISGVCGGLASYFGMSSTMVRLIFAIATLFGYGSFILVYIALSIALPKEPVDLMADFDSFKD